MDWFREFVHIIVVLDEIALVIAIGVFAAGMIVAPVLILVRGDCWWRRRLKWAAVAMLTSWFGLWLFLRGEAKGGGNHPRVMAGANDSWVAGSTQGNALNDSKVFR